MEGMGGCNPYSEVCVWCIYLSQPRQIFFCQLNMAWYMLYSVRSASGHKSVLYMVLKWKSIGICCICQSAWWHFHLLCREGRFGPLGDQKFCRDTRKARLETYVRSGVCSCSDLAALSCFQFKGFMFNQFSKERRIPSKGRSLDCVWAKSTKMWTRQYHRNGWAPFWGVAVKQHIVFDQLLGISWRFRFCLDLPVLLQ